jgi:hypothetical protein
MTVAIAPTEDQLATSVRALLLAILPDGTEVIQGQANRVPEPVSDTFVVFTFIAQQRLSTNVDTYGVTGLEKTITMDNQQGVQLINLLWRDDFSCLVLEGTGISPLYCDDPHQAPFINAENQYENRWVMTVYLQANPVVTVPQDSADVLEIQLYEADQ